MIPKKKSFLSRNEIIVILNRILEEEFELDPSLLKPEASLRDDLCLDSLDGVDLIVAIEKQFHIRVAEEEARAINSLNDIYVSIEKNLGKL